MEDYALDLKNFHEGSHTVAIVPILVSTHAARRASPTIHFADDLVAEPVGTNAQGLTGVFDLVCSKFSFPTLDVVTWIAKGYRPTPTIIQAAEALYRTHRVEEIRRNDAEENLARTRETVFAVIDRSRLEGVKSICFVTGVPGSGKTLAGLDIATRRSEEHAEEHAVFLSGNGPLGDVLREALARDQALREGIPKKAARRKVTSFVQNIYHFRDDNLSEHKMPSERVVVFEEAQRAWTRKQLAKFMMRTPKFPDFEMSEPEFLLSVMDRHPDWCTVLCLVGGGQEINTGEAGISEWMNALETRFPHWKVHISSRMALPEYGSSEQVNKFLASAQL